MLFGDIRVETALIAQQDFRDAMARLGAAVNVITTDGPGGRRGFTASAVCSVTDSPPTLLVCLNRSSDSHAAVAKNGVLCVNTLSADQQRLSPIFAGQVTDDYDARFAAATWTTLATGSPVLEGALANFDGRVVKTLDVGSHTVFFCEVQAVRSAPGDALMYFARGYRTLAG
jgi:flavin reductase